jgi:hypothetical protein
MCLRRCGVSSHRKHAADAAGAQPCHTASQSPLRTTQELISEVAYRNQCIRRCRQAFERLSPRWGGLTVAVDHVPGPEGRSGSGGWRGRRCSRCRARICHTTHDLRSEYEFRTQNTASLRTARDLAHKHPQSDPPTTPKSPHTYDSAYARHAPSALLGALLRDPCDRTRSSSGYVLRRPACPFARHTHPRRYTSP